MQMLEQDQDKDKDNENEEEIEEKDSNNKTDNLKEIYNGQEGQKLNDEELQVLESILRDIETGEDKKAEYDANKLQILENILKKLENKNEEENNNEDSKENENEEEMKLSMSAKEYYATLTDKYSAFDEQGIPIKNAKGNDISKEQYNK